MKKFLSLLCAVAIVLSASAVPVSKKAQAVKFQRAAVEQVRSEKKVPAREVVKPNVLNVAQKAAAPVFRAQKAEALDVTCGSWEIEDWGEDGELYLYAADNTIAFYFDLIYGEDASDLVLGKNYTVEDIYVGSDGQYAAVFYNGNWNYGIKELSIVKTIDEAGLVHFVGSCVDSLDAAFTFHYDEEPFVPTGEEVEYSFAKCATYGYSAYYADWTIKANDAKYAFVLDILSENDESPVGEYDSANGDFDLGYTNVEVKYSNDSSALYQAHSAKATISERNDSLFFYAEIMAENGVLYKMSAFYTAPKKEGEATITATNLVYDDSWYGFFGVIWADASNEEYAVSLTMTDDAENLVAGEGFSGTITNLATGEEAEVYSGAIAISKADGIQITGSVLCMDNIEYTLDLTYVLPEPTSKETINGAGMLYLENQSGLLYWQAVALNADESRYVSLLAIADDPAGTYTKDDLYASSSYIGAFTAPADTAWYTFLAANITVAVEGEVATITGTILGQNDDNEEDIVEYTLNLILEVVDETTPSGGNVYDAKDEAFKYIFPEYTIIDKYLEEYNVYLVRATDEDNRIISLEINVEEGATELAAGVYPITKTNEANTVSAGGIDESEGSIYGSFAGNQNASGQITIPLWLLNEGNVIVLENGVIQVKATNTWGAQIECQLGSWPEAIDNTNDGTKAVKVLRAGKLVIIKNGVEYNAQGAQLR